MSEVLFTGNPFVDAGVAGMCAAAGVAEPGALDQEAIGRAVARLLRLFTSPQALEARPKPGDEKKASALATSELSAIFPNGPHSNPSNRGTRKAELYREQVNGLVAALGAEESHAGTCFACGQPAGVTVTKMDFPLLDSRRNFHPALSEGHLVCARCALAIQFLPISILRTSLGGLFWFISCLDPEVCIPPAAELNLRLIEACVAGNKRMRFYGDWTVPGRASAVLGVVDFLAGRKRDLRAGGKGGRLPVRAVFFSNDNRNAQISVQDVPSSLFRFFSRLRLCGFHPQFTAEVLHVPKLGESVARRLLEEQAIIRQCTSGGDEKNPGVRLLGGWGAHALYMKGVLEMRDEYIGTIEQVALRIAELGDPGKELKKLRLERNAPEWFLSAVSQRLMTRREFYQLVPPNDRKSASAALDYVTGAVADVLRCRERGEEFARWEPTDVDEEQPVHPLVRLVERIGDTVCESNYDPGRLLNNLRSARQLSDLRWAWLRTLQSSAIRWSDFVALVPPGDTRTPYEVRDYMLAYLYDRMATAEGDGETAVPHVESLGYERSEEEWPTQ